MASKKILIQVILDDKNVAAKSNQISKSVDGVTRAQQKYFQALQPTNVEIEKYKLLTKQAQIATEAKARAELNAASATKTGRAQSGLNNAILLETGRLASDASYGFTAIANNLSQVVTLFASFAETNGGVVASLRELGRSLFGIGGILIGVQLLISFGPKILDFFTGMDKAAKKAAESNKELSESLDSLQANIIIAGQYVDLLSDINLSEEKRKNTIKELISLVPDLKEEDFEYGKTLDEVRAKIKLYAIAQASRIEIDKLVEDNSQLLSQRRRINLINEIEDDEKRLQAIKKFAKEEGQTTTLQTSLNGQSTKQVEKSNEQYIASFEKRSKSIIGESDSILDKINELMNTSLLGGKGDGDDDDIANNRLLQKVISVTNMTKNEIDMLFEYLNGKTKDFDFILEKLLEGYNFTQIEQMLSLEKGLKASSKRAEGFLSVSANKAIEELEILVSSDDKYTKNRKKNSKGLKKLNEEERKIRNQQLKQIAGNLSQAASLFGENTSANKTMKIASAVINTYAGANEALAGPVPLNFINAAAVIAAGLANIQKIKSVKVPNERGSASTPTPTQIEAPDFNVVGAGGVSQLATTLAGVTGQPLKAFVVSKEITSAQELERNITNTASVG